MFIEAIPTKITGETESDSGAIILIFVFKNLLYVVGVLFEYSTSAQRIDSLMEQMFTISKY